MGSSWSLKELSPVTAMVTMEFLLVGFTTLNKEAMLKGMSPFFLVFYSNAFATLIIAPFAYFLERYFISLLVILAYSYRASSLDHHSFFVNSSLIYVGSIDHFNRTGSSAFTTQFLPRFCRRGVILAAQKCVLSPPTETSGPDASKSSKPGKAGLLKAKDPNPISTRHITLDKLYRLLWNDFAFLSNNIFFSGFCFVLFCFFFFQKRYHGFYLINIPSCRNQRPSLSLSLLCKLFFMSLIGTTVSHNCVAVAIDYSSPTLASAMKILLPAFTFVLALLFRMEKLNWRSLTAQIKVIGTVLSISGALIVVLYKGPSIVSSSSGKKSTPMDSFLQSPAFISYYHLAKKESSNWTIGGLLFAISWFCVALWTTLQEAISREYPSQLSLVSFYMFFASIQSCVVCFVVKRNHPNAWSLMPDIKIKLIAIIYGAVFGYVGLFCVEVWCIHKKGAVYSSMFKPLGVAIAALMSFIFFGENLHLGTVVGTFITVIGFYGVLWAKSKENREQEEDSQINSISSSSNKLPLLQKNY